MRDRVHYSLSLPSVSLLQLLHDALAFAGMTR